VALNYAERQRDLTGFERSNFRTLEGGVVKTICIKTQQPAALQIVLRQPAPKYLNSFATTQ